MTEIYLHVPFLQALGVDTALAMIIKQRKQAGVIGTMDLVGHVQDCDCIIGMLLLHGPCFLCLVVQLGFPCTCARLDLYCVSPM